MKQTSEHLQRIQASAAERARVLPKMRDYLARTGLGVKDFARRINYAYQTLNLFTNDKYHQVAGTHLLLCRAIEEYIERNPIEPPTEVFGELYETENARVMRQTIQELLKYPVAYMIYGPPGNQKSFVLEYEIARLNRGEASKNGHGCRAYYVYATEGMKPTQLLKEVAVACGSSAIGDMPRIVRNLRFDFRGRRVLLALDEAQHLDVSCLEALRVLLDRPPNFSLLLAGSHTLLTKFDRYSQVLEQWNSRLIEKVMLPGLSEQEAAEIARIEMPGLTDKKIAPLIALATRTDAFNHNKPYINIRTLTTGLRRAKLKQGEGARA